MALKNVKIQKLREDKTHPYIGMSFFKRIIFKYFFKATAVWQENKKSSKKR